MYYLWFQYISLTFNLIFKIFQLNRNDETPLISSFRTDSLHPPCPLFLMDTVWTSLSWLRHETGQVRRSSCNEPVLVIIMSALRAISGQYWDWINQTEVNLQQNSQRWRLPHAHTGIAASQGQCPASPPQTHRGPGNQCIFVTQTPRLEPRAECTQGWVGLKYLVALKCCHVMIVLGAYLFTASWDDWDGGSCSLASVSWLVWCLRVTWCDAVRVIMQWSQLSALTTTRDLGLLGMHSGSGRCHATDRQTALEEKQ